MQTGRANLWRLAFILFVLSLGLRICAIILTGSYHHIERAEVSHIAISMAQTGQFSNAYGPGTGPTAHSTPAYPLLLSVLFLIFGYGLEQSFAQQALSTCFAASIYAMLPALADTLGLGYRTGLVAGLAGGLLPLNFWAETKGSFESAPTALALCALAMLTARNWADGRFNWRRGAMTGLAWGIGVLINSALWPVMFMTLAAGAWLFRSNRAGFARYSIAVVLATVAMSAPWAIRNRLALGALIWTRSNLGLELSIGNSDGASASYHENQRTGHPSLHHPHESAEERAKVAAHGEVAYNAELRSRAGRWIRAHPRRFLELTVKRVYLFWMPSMMRAPQTWAIRLVSCLGIIGFFLLWRQPLIRPALLFAAIFSSFPLIYYLVPASPRYRYPLDWTMWLLAGFTLITAWNRIGRKGRQP